MAQKRKIVYPRVKPTAIPFNETDYILYSKKGHRKNFLNISLGTVLYMNTYILFRRKGKGAHEIEYEADGDKNWEEKSALAAPPWLSCAPSWQQSQVVTPSSVSMTWTQINRGRIPVMTMFGASIRLWDFSLLPDLQRLDLVKMESHSLACSVVLTLTTANAHIIHPRNPKYRIRHPWNPRYCFRHPRNPKYSSRKFRKSRGARCCFDWTISGSTQRVIQSQDTE